MELHTWWRYDYPEEDQGKYEDEHKGVKCDEDVAEAAAWSETHDDDDDDDDDWLLGVSGWWTYISVFVGVVAIDDFCVWFVGSSFSWRFPCRYKCTEKHWLLQLNKEKLFFNCLVNKVVLILLIFFIIFYHTFLF